MIRIGIGCGLDAEKVIRSAVNTASADLIIRCYCCPGAVSITHPGEFVELATGPNPCNQMIDDLITGKIDGAVRGTLPANETLRYLKIACGVPKLERIALLETASHHLFFLAPVGVDEGWSLDEKIAFINDARLLAKKFGISEKTAVLSGGRLGDIGRHPVVDQTIRDAEKVAEATGALHYEILIEDAVRDCGVIIAPDGISGNLIFRTLTFLGHGMGHGAPVVNIPFVFVDSSRASTNYSGSLKLAGSLANGK